MAQEMKKNTGKKKSLSGTGATKAPVSVKRPPLTKSFFVVAYEGRSKISV